MVMSPAPFLVPAVPFSRLTEVPRKSLEDWQGAAGSGPAPRHAVAFPSPQGCEGAAGLRSGVCPIPPSSRPHHHWSRFPSLQSLWLSCARVGWWEASLSLLKQTRFLVSWLLCPVPREELYADLIARSCQERRASPQPRYFECLIGWGPGAEL